MGRIICYGSLNIDNVYAVPHFVRPGETLGAESCARGAGGKGANQSVAAARAGAAVLHAGKIGEDGRFMAEKLAAAGVDVSGITVDPALPSGHALIQIVPEGENAIIVAGGANRAITTGEIQTVFAQAAPDDILLVQNEISRLDEILRAGAAAQLAIAVNFAPFDLAAAQALPLELAQYLIVNETEAAELSGERELDAILASLHRKYPDTTLVLTLGAKGALAQTPDGEIFTAASPKVAAVDTTAAGDTFVGYFLDGRLRGLDLAAALNRACRAAALTVTRPGAVDSIPTAAEVEAFTVS